jgi:hypothetical protein
MAKGTGPKIAASVVIIPVLDMSSAQQMASALGTQMDKASKPLKEKGKKQGKEIGDAVREGIVSEHKLTVVLQDQLTKASAPLKEKAEKEGKGIGERLQRGLIAGLAFGAILLAEANKMQEGFNQIRMGTGATGESFEDLKNVAIDVFKTVPQSFDQVGSAIAAVNRRLGLTGENLAKTSKMFLDLSDATGSDLQQNIRNTDRILADWNMNAEYAEEVNNKLLRASQASGVGITELGSQVDKAGASFQQLGFSLDETIAFAAAFEQSGLNADRVIVGMTRAVANFSKKGIEPFQGIADVFENIAGAATESEAVFIATQTFGNRVGGDIAQGIRNGTVEIDKLLSEISFGSETVSQLDKDTETFVETLTIMKNRLSAEVMPVLNEAAGSFAAILNAVTSLPTEVLAGGIALGVLVFKFQAIQTLLTNVNTNLKQNVKALADSKAGWAALGAAIGVAIVQIAEYIAEQDKALGASKISKLNAPVEQLAAAAKQSAELGFAFGDWQTEINTTVKNFKELVDVRDEIFAGSPGENTGFLEDFLSGTKIIVPDILEGPIGAFRDQDLAALGTGQAALEQLDQIDKMLSSMADTDPEKAATAYNQLVQALVAEGIELEQITKVFDDYDQKVKNTNESLAARKAITEQAARQDELFAQAVKEIGRSLEEGQTWLDKWNKTSQAGFGDVNNLLQAQEAFSDLQKSIADLNKELEELYSERANLAPEFAIPRAGEDRFEARMRANENFQKESKRLDDAIAAKQKQIEQASQSQLNSALQLITAEETLISNIIDAAVNGGIDAGQALNETLARFEQLGVPSEVIEQYRQMAEPQLERATAMAQERIRLREEEEAAIQERFNQLSALSEQTAISTGQNVLLLEWMWSEIDKNNEQGVMDVANRFAEVWGLFVTPEQLDQLRRMLAERGLNTNRPQPEDPNNPAGRGGVADEQLGWFFPPDEDIGVGRRIPGAAMGGPVKGGNPYIVGEIGPELFVPNVNGAIVTNRDLIRGISGIGSGGNITNVFQTRELSAAQLAEEVSYRQGRQLNGRQR